MPFRKGARVGYPTTDTDAQFEDDKKIKGIWFSVPLTEVTYDDGPNRLVEKITEHRESLLVR